MTEETTLILHEISTLKDSMIQQFKKVDERLDNVEALARGNRIILENDIPKQINLIAEGHMDLNRKLQAAEEANRKYDNVMINIVAMQNDIRKIKDRLEMA